LVILNEGQFLQLNEEVFDAFHIVSEVVVLFVENLLIEGCCSESPVERTKVVFGMRINKRFFKVLKIFFPPLKDALPFPIFIVSFLFNFLLRQ
jgi:hypothetical protein